MTNSEHDDLQCRVREAFDALTPPEQLNARTLTAIEAARLTSSAPPRARIITWRRGAWAVAACLILVLVGFAGFRWYSTPTAFVGIDVNPSIELQINSLDRVVAAQGINDDGLTSLESMSLVGMTYEDAIAALTSSAAFAPYVSPDSYLEISITCENQTQEQKLQAASNACLATLPCQGSCQAVNTEELQAARAVGMGVGRYRAALELMELDPTVTLEECASLPMRELHDRIEACTDDYPSVNNGGEEHGHGSNSGSGEGNDVGHGTGAGNDSGSGTGIGTGNGNGSGSGTGNGNAIGTGAGNGTGNGVGAGNGNGNGTERGNGSTSTNSSVV